MGNSCTKVSSNACLPGPPSRRSYLAEGAVYVGLAAVSCLALGGVVPAVRFESELIRVTVDGQNLHVDGIYRYRNPFPFPIVQGLSCPTPSGDGLRPVEGIAVERLSDGSGELPALLPVRRVAGTPYFEVKVPGRTTVEVRVRYVQRHGGFAGRYLLTTTKPWRRPLKRARYELTLVSSRLVRSNYPLTGDGRGKYHFERDEFMPQEDWCFEFIPEGGG